MRIETNLSASGERDVSFLLDPHQHTILHVAHGSATLELLDREVRVEDGELLLIGSQDHRAIRRLMAQAGRFGFLAFHADAIMCGTSFEERAEYLRTFEGPGKLTPHRMAAAAEGVAEIADLMERIEGESEKVSQSATAHATLKIKTLLKLILVLLRPQPRDENATAAAHPRDYARLEPLMDYLTQHYMEAISVEQAAQILNMSKSHFMRYFRRTTGSAFVPYLNQLRISKAQALMGRSKLSIAEVAESVGLYDQSYFSKVFRRISGIGPREYRNQTRNLGPIDLAP